MWPWCTSRSTAATVNRFAERLVGGHPHRHVKELDQGLPAHSASLRKQPGSGVTVYAGHGAVARAQLFEQSVAWGAGEGSDDDNQTAAASIICSARSPRSLY